jgi:tripartite-type tricarboxylate transporter receptor subunit TctC
MRNLLAPAAAGALALRPAGLGNAYPARPLKTVIPFRPQVPPTSWRLVAHKVGEKIGQSIMVENRPGAGGTLGLDAVARAPADGYSLYLAAVTNQMIAGHLYHKADLQRDFVPVALIANAPHLLIVNNEVPAKTMAEFVTCCAAGGGTVNFASQGWGTLSHLESELLLQHTGTQAVHALQGQRHGGDRYAVGRRVLHVRQCGGLAAADPGRQGACAGRGIVDGGACRAQSADGDAGRCVRL